MALLWFDGAEQAEARPEWSNLSGRGTTQAGYSGTAYFMMGSNGGAIRQMPAASTVIIGGRTFWQYNSQADMLTFRTDSGASDQINISTATQGQGAYLTAKRGTTVIGTATLKPLNYNIWYYIEVKVKIDPTAGFVVVKVDGTEVINFTGNTKNTGTSNNIDAIKFFTPGSGQTAYWDDLYCCDATGTVANDFLGDCKVESLVPNGNGAVNAWVGSDGNSTDNYLLVDEIPPNTTDYVQSNTVGQQDFYTLSDLAATTGNVLGVQALARAQKTDAGAAAVKPLYRTSDGTVTTGTAQALSTSWTTVAGSVRTVNPTTGLPWTMADVNALQIGVETA